MAPAFSDNESAARGPHACDKCNRSKRGCDRALPKCSRCNRLYLSCTYDFVLAPSNNRIVLKYAEFSAFLRARGGIGPVLENVDALSNKVDFLGDNINSLGDFEPSQITRLLDSNKIDWRAAAAEYFSTIHGWFSIVQRDRFEAFYDLSTEHDSAFHIPSSSGSSIQDIGTTVDPQVSSADGALFLVCLYLITQIASSQRPNTQIFCPLYRSVKRIFALLKCLTEPTVELIQCGAFITLFEYGHGDTISAYRTLSETVALARVLGLKPGKYLEEEKMSAVSWEEEECRAIWWGLFILDHSYLSNSHQNSEECTLVELHYADLAMLLRCIHLYAPARHLPLLMETPSEDDLLPTVTSRHGSIRLPLSVPVSVELTSFQRSAQSAVLLHRVLNQHSQLDPCVWPPAAEALDVEIRMLLNAMINQPNSWELPSDPFALCIGALFVLYSPFLPSLELLTDANHYHHRHHEASKDCRTIQAFSAIAFAVRFLTDFLQSKPTLQAEHEHEHLPNQLAAMSPVLNICGFQAMEALLRLDGMIVDAGAVFAEVRNAVQKCSQRWRIGEFVLLEISALCLARKASPITTAVVA